MNFPIETLITYHIDNKIRIGPPHDGGYIIVDGFNYDVLIGCGIGCNTSFEEDFLDKYPNILCYAFDGTIQNLSIPHERIFFIQKNISDKDTQTETNLHKLMNNYNNIFLKMDIEEGEYPWFHSLSTDQLNKYKQIIIEIHKPFNEYRWKCLQKINQTHYLVNIHGNNIAGKILYTFGETEEIIIGNSDRNTKTVLLKKIYPSSTKLVIKDHNCQDRFDYNLKDNILTIKRIDQNCGWGYSHIIIINAQYIPRVFECTYIRKKDIPHDLPLNNIHLPSILDKPNAPDLLDIDLYGYPYSTENFPLNDRYRHNV